ncbi:MAG TPA: hypothetical protein VGK25_11950, partial [Ignavibacteria bacterium]
MKTRFILYFVFLSTPYLFSQDEIGIPKLKPVNDYWSLGFYASGNIGLSNGYVEDAVHPGFGGTLELSYRDSRKNAILIISKNDI